jgi:hypothetical protein
LAAWRPSGDEDDEKNKGQELNYDQKAPDNQGPADGPRTTTYRELQAMEEKIKTAPIHIPGLSQPSAAGSSQNPHAELQAMENLIESAPISIPKFSPSGGLHGSPATHGVVVGPTEEDKKQIAKKAMEEYLDQDDGSDAFLACMADLMEEDEEE